MDIQKYLAVKFSKHYEDYIGEIPTKEQLEVYMDYHLEKEPDFKDLLKFLK